MKNWPWWALVFDNQWRVRAWSGQLRQNLQQVIYKTWNNRKYEEIFKSENDKKYYLNAKIRKWSKKYQKQENHWKTRKISDTRKNIKNIKNYENIAITQKIWKIAKNIENVGREGRLGKTPRYPISRSPMFNHPYNGGPDRLLSLLNTFPLN